MVEMDSSLWNPEPKYPLPPENRLGPVFYHSHGKNNAYAHMLSD